MVYRHITLHTLAWIAFIVASALLAGYATAYRMDPGFLLLLLPIPLAGWKIVRMFNQSNRQIAFFFEAIRNEDSSLKFPESIREKSLRHLYRSLNQLNERITEIKLQNEYLEKYYQAFIRHAATGLMAVNSDNELEIMNDKAFEYAGIPSYTPLHLVPGRNPDLFGIAAMIMPGETLSYKRRASDLQINLLIRSREIHYGGKKSKLISLQDISHELDEKELDAWQKLIRVQTHEIMNSIAPIVSLTSTIRKFFVVDGSPVKPKEIDSDTIENVIQGLDTIEERGNGLINFVNGYRKLTRIPKPEFSVFPVREWLEHLQLLMQESIAQRGITLTMKIDPKIKNLSGDNRLLSQVMLNVLNNAMEALSEIPENRKIGISVETSRQNHILIRITNNGTKISPETAEKIFIPFFTTRENGSGIGLSLSRQILQLHKGMIHLETDEETTSFVITL